MISEKHSEDSEFVYFDFRNSGAGLLRACWESRALFLKIVGLSTLLIAGIALLIPNYYRSNAVLMVADQNQDMNMALLQKKSGADLGFLAGDLFGSKDESALFEEVLQSRTVQTKIAKQFGFQDRKLFGLFPWRRSEEGARRVLSEKTSISLNRKTGTLSLTVTDRDPARAKSLVDAYIEELDYFFANSKMFSARRERLFLETRLKEVNSELTSAEKEFAQYSSQNRTVNIDEQAKAMVGAAASVQGDLIAAKSQLSALRQIYKDDNVRVTTMKARTEALQQQLEKVLGPTPDPNTKVPGIAQLPLLGVRYAELYRNVKVKEAVLEELTRQYEIARVREVKEVPSFQLIDAPIVPDVKSGPPRTLILLLGIMLSILGTMAWIYLRLRWSALDKQDPYKLLIRDISIRLRSSSSLTREAKRD